MQINRINSNGNNFGAKLTPEITRQLRGVLGNFLRTGEVDLYEKSISHVRDLKKLSPNGKIVAEDFSVIQYGTPYIRPIIVMKRPDYKDYTLLEGKINSFEDISNLAKNVKNLEELPSKPSKYTDLQIKSILDDDLPIGG